MGQPPIETARAARSMINKVVLYLVCGPVAMTASLASFKVQLNFFTMRSAAIKQLVKGLEIVHFILPCSISIALYSAC